MENPEHRCSKCIYWKNRECVMIHQVKNDSICICGQFKKREEKK